MTIRLLHLILYNLMAIERYLSIWNEHAPPTAGLSQPTAAPFLPLSLRQRTGVGEKINVGGGGGEQPLFQPPPPFGRGFSVRLPKKAPSLTHPLSKGGLFGIAHRAPFSAILHQKTLKHLWWTKI